MRMWVCIIGYYWPSYCNDDVSLAKFSIRRFKRERFAHADLDTRTDRAIYVCSMA